MPNVINGTSTGSGGLITTGDDSGILNIQTNETTAMSIDASQSVDFTNNIDAPNTFGFKNRIINGNMVIDQRNAGASVTNVGGTVYTVDRWAALGSQASKYTVQQNAGSVTPPAGYTNYLGVTSSSAYALTGNDYFAVAQQIEANNVSDFGLGAAGAVTFTLSFWVRSSLTGSFGGSFQNSAENRCYSFAYTINAANTWEYKTVTATGDTSGTWLTGTNTGMYVWFGLGATGIRVGTANAWGTQSVSGLQPSGTTSVVSTNGATFYVTGVQLEKGTQATSFDFRSYGTELALCQRYFTVLLTGTSYVCANAFSTNRVLSCFFYPATMRATPTAATSGTFTYFISGAAYASSAITLTPKASGSIEADVTVTATTGGTGVLATNASITLTAEL